MHVFTPSLKWSFTVSSLGIVQWDFTKRDHPGNPGRVSGPGPVTTALLFCIVPSGTYYTASYSFLMIGQGSQTVI